MFKIAGYIRYPRRWLPLSIAFAGGALISGSSFAPDEVRATASAAPITAVYSSEPGQRRNFKLPDTGDLVLNGGARVEIEFTSRTRKVKQLYGNALYRVAKDESRPFTVDTEHASTTAVGTVFAVSKRMSYSVVTVLEGTVRVVGHGESADGSEQNPIEVHADQQVCTFARLPAEPASVDAAEEIASVHGSLPRRMTVDEAIRHFNRSNKYQITVDVPPAIRGKSVTIAFPTCDPRGYEQLVRSMLERGVVIKRP